MSRKLSAIAVLAVFVLIGASIPASAHHAFAAEFDVNAPVQVKGKIAKLDWTNPHAWLYVDVVEADQVVLTTTANTEATVLLNADTKYEKEGKVVDRSALVPGARVSIDLSEDDRTAVKVKIGAGGGHHDGHH